MKILIADTSPIISLLLIQQLDLLEKLFEEIFIPSAVWDELNQHGPLLLYKREMNILSGKVVHPEKIQDFPTIDKGEIEAIALYLELNAAYLLIDDKKGRQVAEANGINCIGTLTVLVSAKRKGLITGLKGFFEMLLANKRFYAKEILNEILAAENEPLL